MQEKEKEGLFLHWCQDAILGNLLLKVDTCGLNLWIIFFFSRYDFAKQETIKWHVIMKVPVKRLFLKILNHENYTFKVSLIQTTKNCQWRTLEIISKDIQNSFRKHSKDFQKVKQNCRFGGR